MKRVVICLALAGCVLAGDKKDWKIGHIVDSQTSDMTVDFGFGPTTIRNREVQLSGDFLYNIDKLRSGNGLRGFYACRFIIGDDTKYRAEKQKLWIIDADGKECVGEIVRQERVTPPAPAR